MLAPTLSSATTRRSLIAIVIACCLFSTAPVRAAGVTIIFHATVSGKAKDAGGFSLAESPAPTGNPALKLTYVGCALINEGGSPATYRFEVRTTGTYFAGMKPAQPGVYLTIDNYKPGVSSATYKGMDAGGTFAISGHSYGDGVTPPNSVVQIRDGGHSGTWSDTAALRNYPAKILGAIHGFRFTSTWRCTAIYHVKAG